MEDKNLLMEMISLLMQEATVKQLRLIWIVASGILKDKKA